MEEISKTVSDCMNGLIPDGSPELEDGDYILIKNGYAVRQTKRKRTETGKTLDYYLVVSECDETADTSR